MGTARPRVRIEAATLAGGDNNQDRYAYGDGWAFVLDGATSYSDTPPIHDGGWYAERLKNALAPRLTTQPDRPTVDIVADAIQEAASAHHPSQGPCPTSTIALARWDADQVELHVLGDSYAYALTDEGPTILTDNRIKQFGKGLRTLYRQRLREGHGFDDRHREILQALQRVEAAHRNRARGYWVLGDNRLVGAQGISVKRHAAEVTRILLATDGVPTGQLTDCLRSRRAVPAAAQILSLAEEAETLDTLGCSHPRAKKSDDKTLIVVTFARVGPPERDS